MWLKREVLKVSNVEGNRTKYIVSCASVTILPMENMLRKHNITPLALWDTLKTPENIT